MNNGPVSISNGLLLSIYIQPSRFVTICGFVFVGRLHCYDMVCYTSRSKIKRAKRPCAYYCNSSATFHCPLEGDLVFKLNPGPMNDHQTIRSHCSLVRRSSLTTRTRNLSNLITITVKISSDRAGRVLYSSCSLYHFVKYLKQIVIRNCSCDH
jgi:hypothetical protein